MKKHQNLVKEFHQAAGQPVAEKITTLHPDRLKLRLALIAEEAKELEEAVFSSDRVETLDALCDLQYVVCGKAVEEGVTMADQNDIDTTTSKLISKMDKFQAIDVILKTVNSKISSSYNAHKIVYLASLFGFDERVFFAAFKAVHESNMSKFCRSEAEADETVKNYFGQDIFSYWKKNEQTGTYTIYRSGDDKVLKSINYTPVDLRELAKNDFRKK